MGIELHRRVFLTKKELFAKWLCGEPSIERLDDSCLQVIGERIGKDVLEAYLRKEVNGDEYILAITDQDPWVIGRTDNQLDVRQFFGFE